MMAVINLSSVLEYGRPNGVLRKIGCVGTREASGPQAAAAMRVMAKKAAAGVPGSTPLNGVDEERMDVDDENRPDRSPLGESHGDDELPDQPPAFKFALQLTFAMLSHVLRHPTSKAHQALELFSRYFWVSPKSLPGCSCLLKFFPLLCTPSRVACFSFKYFHRSLLDWTTLLVAMVHDYLGRNNYS